MSTPNEGGPIRWDLLATLEDVIDTWGPGNFVIEAGNVEPSAVIVSGGIICASNEASSIDEGAKLHWSPSIFGSDTSMSPIDPRLRQAIPCIDPRRKVIIGAEVIVNDDCVRDGEKHWKQSCVLMTSLGTWAPRWSQDERQLGLQSGNFAIVQANVTWRKIPGRTLKQHKLEQSNEALVASLEDPWGLQVSFCTGVSRRVRLREVIADL